jgi:hypothetical protein
MTFISNHGLYYSGTYLPFTCDIIAIALGQTTVFTTSVPHAFVIGNEVGFQIPKEFGTRQLNHEVGYVLSLTDTTVEVNIDSTHFDTFIIPTVNPLVVLDPPQIIPIGDANTGYVLPGGAIPPLQIPGAFRNIYP